MLAVHTQLVSLIAQLEKEMHIGVQADRRAEWLHTITEVDPATALRLF